MGLVMNANTLLRKYFGYREFRPGQKGIITSLMQGRDVFSLLQTGGGKSICFQIPALAKAGTCLVICPLISLMYDQVKTLKKKGISAEFLNSQQEYKTRVDVEKRLADGHIKFLYVAPERILTDRLFEILKNIDLSMIVYDEAHVITEWGEAFRPAYITALEKIKALEAHKAHSMEQPSYRLQKAVFSASIIKQARADIIDKSNLVRPAIHIHSFARNNINLNVIKYHLHKLSKLDILCHQLKRTVSKASIIYAGSRKECETVAGRLSVRGIRATYYHAGLNAIDRKQKMDLFMKGKVDAIVCTSAFGMGIDKNNVRQVFHWSLPPTIEDMYQEMGRAGRDGLTSDHFAFYDDKDAEFAKRMLIANYPTAESVNKAYHFIRIYTQRMNSNTIEEEPTFLSDIIGQPVIKEQIRAIFDHFIRIGFLSEIKTAIKPNATGSSKTRVFEVNDTDVDLMLNSVDKKHTAAHKKHAELIQYFETKTCRSQNILKYLGEPDESYIGEQCKHCDNCSGEMAPLPIKENPPQSKPKTIFSNDEKLHKRISGLVKAFSKKNKIPAHIIVPPLSINRIVKQRPMKAEELKAIGLPQKTIDEIGNTLISIIKEMENHAGHKEKQK